MITKKAQKTLKYELNPIKAFSGLAISVSVSPVISYPIRCYKQMPTVVAKPDKSKARKHRKQICFYAPGS